MGSFNLNCGLTGLTIGPGQQTVILPIVPYDLRYLKYLNRDEGIKKLVQEEGVTKELENYRKQALQELDQTIHI